MGTDDKGEQNHGNPLIGAVLTEMIQRRHSTQDTEEAVVSSDSEDEETKKGDQKKE